MLYKNSTVMLYGWPHLPQSTQSGIAATKPSPQRRRESLILRPASWRTISRAVAPAALDCGSLLPRKPQPAESAEKAKNLFPKNKQCGLSSTESTEPNSLRSPDPLCALWLKQPGQDFTFREHQQGPDIPFLALCSLGAAEITSDFHATDRLTLRARAKITSH